MRGNGADGGDDGPPRPPKAEIEENVRIVHMPAMFSVFFTLKSFCALILVSPNQLYDSVSGTLMGYPLEKLFRKRFDVKKIRTVKMLGVASGVIKHGLLENGTLIGDFPN